jgi:hypothetical protein
MNKYLFIFCSIFMAAMSGCSSVRYMEENERNWQTLHAVNTLAQLSARGCAPELATLSGVALGDQPSASEIIVMSVGVSWLHYQMSEAMYKYAPERFARAWRFVSIGVTGYEAAANIYNAGEC